MFQEGQEALFFSSPAELVERMHWITANPDRVREIADAGRRRVLSEHGVLQRMRELLPLIQFSSPEQKRA